MRCVEGVLGLGGHVVIGVVLGFTTHRPLKRHGLVPMDETPSNMIATCGGIGTAKVVQVLDFLAGIVGVNGVMRFLVLEEPTSTGGRQQFIPPLTPITIMRQLGANIRNEG